MIGGKCEMWYGVAGIDGGVLGGVLATRCWALNAGAPADAQSVQGAPTRVPALWISHPLSCAVVLAVEFVRWCAALCSFPMMIEPLELHVVLGYENKELGPAW
jgi:hypothetical protein